jgi:serine/threonine protein kinase/tetratricopeptide (TPR) repeat protein
VPIQAGEWELAQRLFEGARVLPPDQRTTWLEETCTEHPRLRDHVRRMIEFDSDDPTFLETPLVARLFSRSLLEPGDLVDGRFRIVRLAGAGGMGEVYEAVDIALGERVALKTVRRHLAGVRGTAARLRHEVRLAHRVTHTNVCKVHHLGVDRRAQGDLLYMTMDYLEGETLFARLRANGPLPRAEAAAIAAQLAEGLDAAHRDGVVHRDLKSSNVMLVQRKEGGVRAVITDFGIAAEPADEAIPESGTEAYMAPERFGRSAPKPSGDIYAFGVILFEMITGTLPFPPGTPPAERRQPPPSGNRRWDGVIRACLDPSPGNRPATAARAVGGLRPGRRRLARAAIIAAIPMLAAGLAIDPPRGGSVDPGVLAIFPFEAAGESGRAIAEYLAGQLQKDPAIRNDWQIVAPSELRQAGVRSPERARAVFGASHVLTGGLAEAAGSVTVAGQVVDARTMSRVQDFRQACPSADAACLQGGLLRAVGRVLTPGYAGSTPAISGEAWKYYLQGLQHLHRDSVSYAVATPLFERAIAADPAAVQPRIALAEARLLEFRDKGDRSMLAAAHAILDPLAAAHGGLPELHATRGILYRYEGRYEDGARELRQAVRADPTNHVYHRHLAQVLDASKQDPEAIAAFEEALRLGPRDWAVYIAYAVFHYRRGRFQEAAALLERLIAWAPDHAQSLATLAGIYVAAGRNAEAITVATRSCELQPGRTCYVNLGIALQRLRRTREAIDAYQAALKHPPPSLMLLLNIADAYAYLPEREQALRYFRQAAAKARESLTVNLRASGDRAILAYCLAQTGDPEGAVWELEQARSASPDDRNVQKYAVLTYEALGRRDDALAALGVVVPQVLKELEMAWGAENLRRDPRYEAVARTIRHLNQ